jgi:O-antigen/teichoic acid export membrane protein
MSVTAAAFPLAVKSLHTGSRDNAYRQIILNGLVLFGLVLPTAVGLCILAEPLITLVIAAPFRDATLAVLPFAAGAGAARNIRSHIADQVFLLVEEPRVVLMINVTEALAVALGCVIGLKFFGLGGAAAGCFASSALSLVLGFGLARRWAGLHVPYADTGRVLVATLAMALAILFIPWDRFAIDPILRLAAEVLFGVVVYSAAIMMLFPALVRGAYRGFQRFPAQ